MTNDPDLGKGDDRKATIDAVCRAMIALFEDRAAAVAAHQIEDSEEADVFATWREIAAGIAEMQSRRDPGDGNSSK